MLWKTAVTLALATFVTPGALDAQRTWVVDANNGAGTDFTDLPPAVTAATDGDRIIVRAGSYAPTTFDKTLTVLGEGNVSVGSITVQSLAAGKALVLEGLTSLSMNFNGNQGRIHLDRCRVLPLLFPFTSMRDCRLVTANTCTFVNLSATDSKLLFTDCSVQSGSTNNPVPWSSSNCDVVLVDCFIRGMDAMCTFFQLPPSQAMSVGGGTLLLSGDDCFIAAGSDSAICFSHPAVSAISCGGAVIRRDPGVVVAGTNGGAPISGSCTVRNESLPAVTAAGAPPGGTLTSDVYTPAGTLSVLLISVSSLDVPTPFGTLWVSLANFSIDAGVVGATEHRQHSLAVGATWFRGLSVTLQAVTLPATGPIELSQPVIVVLD